MFKPDHIALRVKNIARSRLFYSRIGATVTSKPSERFLELQLGAVTLHLLADHSNISSQSAKASCIDHFAVQVSSLAELESLCHLLNDDDEIAAYGPFVIDESPPMGAGLQVERRPPLKALYFRDPDGIQIECRCY